MESIAPMPTGAKFAFKKILPPLLLLPLWITPWDVGGLIYWMLGAMAALVSLLNLLLLAFKRGGRGVTENYPPFWLVGLRSLLTLAIFCVAVLAGLAVDAAASQHADELARRLQQQCQAQGRCPTVPDGWRVDGKIARSSYGHWKLAYVTNASQSEFGLWVHRRNENEQCVHGGSAVALSRTASVACQHDPNVRSSSY